MHVNNALEACQGARGDIQGLNEPLGAELYPPVLSLATLTDKRSRSLAATLYPMPRPLSLQSTAPQQDRLAAGHNQHVASTKLQALRPHTAQLGASSLTCGAAARGAFGKRG